jgi:hypothetical protein
MGIWSSKSLRRRQRRTDSGKIYNRRGRSARLHRETRNEDRGRDAAYGVDAPGARQWVRSDRLSRACADHVFPTRVRRGSGGNRIVLRARDVGSGDATPVRPGFRTRRRIFTWVTPNSRSRTEERIGTTPAFSWTKAANPFPGTERCIRRATPNTSLGADFRLSRAQTTSTRFCVAQSQPTCQLNSPPKWKWSST